MLKSSAICPRLHFYCTYQPFEIWTNKLNVKFQVFVFPKVSRKWSISDNQEIIIGQMSISAQVRPSSRRGNLHNFYIFLCTEDWSITIKQRLAHTCFFIQALNSFSSVDCPVICRSSDKMWRVLSFCPPVLLYSLWQLISTWLTTSIESSTLTSLLLTRHIFILFYRKFCETIWYLKYKLCLLDTIYKKYIPGDLINI